MSHSELLEKLGGKESALFSVARLLGINLPDPETVKSLKFHAPYRQDQKPSCSYYRGQSGEWLIRDWADDEKPLDFIGFYGKMTGIADRRSAWIDLVKRIDGRKSEPKQPLQSFPSKIEKNVTKKVHKPSNIHKGTIREMGDLASLRKLRIEGISAAQNSNWLRFGEFRGEKCWFICNPVNAEPAQARLMSGEKWWGKEKSMTITGSKTILGIEHLQDGMHIAILEGGGDLLAFFSLRLNQSASPICSLGGTHKPKEVLIEKYHDYFMWSIVTIYQHNDETGRKMTEIWRNALANSFCILEVFKTKGSHEAGN